MRRTTKRILQIPRDGETTSGHEVPRLEVPRLEVPRLEAPRLEVPRLEVPRLEVPRLEVPRLEVMARGRARTGLLVTAFAALSAAGLVMPETAGATTTALRPLERIVLPPATVRNASAACRYEPAGHKARPPG